ncbi:MAG: DNA repair protein, partial [Nitrosopumilus sp.]|nr:DNA repair protein [Nitrosopumilus sp.]
MKNKFTIDVDNSINSGQVFLWQKNEMDWYGIDGQNILKINQNGGIKSIKNVKTEFFRKNDDIQKIIKSISKDKTIKKAVNEYEG